MAGLPHLKWGWVDSFRRTGARSVPVFLACRESNKGLVMTVLMSFIRKAVTWPLHLLFVSCKPAIQVVAFLGFAWAVITTMVFGPYLLVQSLEAMGYLDGGASTRFAASGVDCFVWPVSFVVALVVWGVLFRIAGDLLDRAADLVIVLGGWNNTSARRRAQTFWWGSLGFGGRMPRDKDDPRQQQDNIRRNVESGASPPWMDPGAIPPPGYWPEGTHGANNPRRDPD